MSHTIPLDLLAVGEPAVIDVLDGSDDEVHRLREMGISPGANVEMLRSGSPCIVRIGDQRLCLRCHDSTSIYVKPKSA